MVLTRGVNKQAAGRQRVAVGPHLRIWNWEFLGCGAKEFGIFGDEAGVWSFLVAFRKALWDFPRPDHDFKEFRGFPGMELGIFRVAKSAGEGRYAGPSRSVDAMAHAMTHEPRRLDGDPS